MNQKNKERVGRIVVQLQAIQETDKDLNKQEEESVEMALYHLKGLADGIAYMTDVPFDEDDLRV